MFPFLCQLSNVAEMVACTQPKIKYSTKPPAPTELPEAPLSNASAGPSRSQDFDSSSFTLFLSSLT